VSLNHSSLKITTRGVLIVINGYTDFSLESPACHPGVIFYSARFKFDRDVSELFPYINAVCQDAAYFDKPHYIKFSLDGHGCALYPEEIIVGAFENREQALQFFERLKGFMNDLFSKQDRIEPDHTKYRPIPVFSVFKLLPGTNCRQCGFQTCMAFAAALSKKEADLDQCPDLTSSENENRQKLQALGL